MIVLDIRKFKLLCYLELLFGFLNHSNHVNKLSLHHKTFPPQPPQKKEALFINHIAKGIGALRNYQDFANNGGWTHSQLLLN